MRYSTSMYWLYLACAEHAVDSAITSAEVGHDLSDFARMSLDLRGHRPSLEEVQQFIEEPRLDNFIDEFLFDEHFSEQMGWVWNKSIHTALWADQYNRFGDWDEETWRAVGWEPMASLQMIIDEERSFLDWVTADTQAVHPATASLWGLPYDGIAWGWTDMEGDRPHAGVLSSRALWLRYNADTTNRNRMRANVVADVFLCSSFLERTGTFEFEALASALNNVEKAIQTEPGCTGCHSGLDALGSFFGGFTERSTDLPVRSFVAYSAFQAQWHAQRLAPAYYGVPGADLSDLGRYIAQDPRYTMCAVERLGASFFGTEPSLQSKRNAQKDFQASDYRIRPLVRSLILDPSYANAKPRLLSPVELYGTLEKVFGVAVPEALKWSHKHHVLLGFGNDNDILLDSNSFGVSHHLVTEWVAKEISQELVLDLQRDVDDRIVLRIAQDQDEQSARAQVHFWCVSLRTQWIDIDSPQIDRVMELFQAVGGWQNPEASWPLVLEAVLRHPKVMMK